MEKSKKKKAQPGTAREKKCWVSTPVSARMTGRSGESSGAGLDCRSERMKTGSSKDEDVELVVDVWTKTCSIG